ncbi:hypothetical protein IEO21_08608 [Rhodonia placenta]|uniref:Uncharacterized protein n=1 Tax=Rhodonia placenta TaxID=104341 RepID=A0A8H7NVX2_9APHY|nr:hypothetical protein IEO21_08608 [Postia placenta]
MCSTQAFLDKLDVPLASLMATSGDKQLVGIAVDGSCWKPGMLRICAETESMDTVSPMDTLLDPTRLLNMRRTATVLSWAWMSPSTLAMHNGILPWPGCKRLPAQPQRHLTNQTPETRKNQQLLSLLVKATAAACLSYLIPLYCDARNQSTKISHQRMVIPNLLVSVPRRLDEHHSGSRLLTEAEPSESPLRRMTTLNVLLRRQMRIKQD